jgi:hypothetical protein
VPRLGFQSAGAIPARQRVAHRHDDDDNAENHPAPQQDARDLRADLPGPLFVSVRARHVSLNAFARDRELDGLDRGPWRRRGARRRLRRRNRRKTA